MYLTTHENQSLCVCVNPPLFCLMFGLGFVLLNPNSGLEESDCLSISLRTVLYVENTSI